MADQENILKTENVKKNFWLSLFIQFAQKDKIVVFAILFTGIIYVLSMALSCAIVAIKHAPFLELLELHKTNMKSGIGVLEIAKVVIYGRLGGHFQSAMQAKDRIKKNIDK